MSTLTHTAPQVAPERIFDRVLVGVDGSPESLEALRQATLLGPPSELTLLRAWTVAPPVLVAPMTPLPALDIDQEAARERADADLAEALSTVPGAVGKLVQATPGDALLHELAHGAATLLALGSHGHGRAGGVLVGSTATRLLHAAPGAVLLARGTWLRPPRRIAVGVDGSPESGRAHAAAASLAQRLGAELTVVVAEGKRHVDAAAVSLLVGDGFHVLDGEPADVLTAVSDDVDLLVVGSHPRRGLRALGSVSERVAHRAACSTLIVR